MDGRGRETEPGAGWREKFQALPPHYQARLRLLARRVHHKALTIEAAIEVFTLMAKRDLAADERRAA